MGQKGKERTEEYDVQIGRQFLFDKTVNAIEDFKFKRLVMQGVIVQEELNNGSR